MIYRNDLYLERHKRVSVFEGCVCQYEDAVLPVLGFPCWRYGLTTLSFPWGSHTWIDIIYIEAGLWISRSPRALNFVKISANVQSTVNPICRNVRWTTTDHTLFYWLLLARLWCNLFISLGLTCYANWRWHINCTTLGKWKHLNACLTSVAVSQCQYVIDHVRPNGTIWRHGSGSTLARVIDGDTNQLPVSKLPYR